MLERINGQFVRTLTDERMASGFLADGRRWRRLSTSQLSLRNGSYEVVPAVLAFVAACPWTWITAQLA
jgi:hypothetical protein